MSKNRDLQETVKEAEAMLSNVKISELPSYELGMERGLEQILYAQSVEEIFGPQG